jgi:hypothetical protein
MAEKILEIFWVYYPYEAKGIPILLFISGKMNGKADLIQKTSFFN